MAVTDLLRRGRRALIGLASVGVGLWVLAPRAAGQAAPPLRPSNPGQTTAPLRPSNAGPVAVGMRSPTEAAVLRLDGLVRTIDIRTWDPVLPDFQVPSRYQAVDLAAAATSHGPLICLAVNSRLGKTSESYLLQVVNGRQIWSWLKNPGVYVGVAVDAPHGVAYISNSSTNQIFRLQLEQEKQNAVEVRRILDGVDRLGALAIDLEGQRLFAADASNRVFVIQLPRGTLRTVETPGLDDIRAITWDAASRRLYVADSGNEGIWSVAVDGGSSKPQLVLRDRRFRQPSGVVVPHAGSLLVTDESANALLEVLTPSGKVSHVTSLLPRAASQ